MPARVAAATPSSRTPSCFCAAPLQVLAGDVQLACGEPFSRLRFTVDITALTPSGSGQTLSAARQSAFGNLH